MFSHQRSSYVALRLPAEKQLSCCTRSGIFSLLESSLFPIWSDKFIFTYVFSDKMLNVCFFLLTENRAEPEILSWLTSLSSVFGASKIAVSPVVYREVAISHLCRSRGSWSISLGEIVTPRIPACRQGFMGDLQNQDAVKRPRGKKREREEKRW